MNRLPDLRVGVVIVAFWLVVVCRDLPAQSTTAATASMATSTGTGMGMGTGMNTGMGTGIGTGTSIGTGMGGMGMGMGMGGMGLMPMMSAMNPSASLSPTDAAALGMPRPNNGMNAVNGVFANPMAAPYLLGYPMSPNQIATMMMMNQMGASGLGSGQMSGVRPGAGGARGRTKQPPPKPPGTTATPGGLASRYFNRTTTVNRRPNVNRIPQNYYTRQNRYYPQVVR